MEAPPVNALSSSKSELPRITYLLFCYNQARTVARAVESALAQDYPTLEIILSDDCSTDDSFEGMQAAAANYQGPHTLQLNRNPENLGLIGHVNRAFELASGELVVLAAGDDYSVPGRVSTLVNSYLQEGRRPLLLHSSVRRVKDGIPGRVWDPPVIKQRLSLKAMSTADSIYIGATACVSRELYEIFGPIKYEGAFEDLVLGFRAALLGLMSYVNAPLVEYTVDQGLSARTDSAIGDRQHRLAARAAALEVMVAVLGQRLEDLDAVTERLDPSVLAFLRKHLIQHAEELGVRRAFYRDTRELQLSCFSSRSWRSCLAHAQPVCVIAG